MQIDINGVKMTLVSTGRVSRGGKEIFELKGARGSDGTEFYITAYRPVADGETKAAHQSAIDSANRQVNGGIVRPKVRKAVAANGGIDMAALIQQVTAAVLAAQSK